MTSRHTVAQSPYSTRPLLQPYGFSLSPSAADAPAERLARRVQEVDRAGVALGLIIGAALVVEVVLAAAGEVAAGGADATGRVPCQLPRPIAL